MNHSCFSLVFIYLHTAVVFSSLTVSISNTFHTPLRKKSEEKRRKNIFYSVLIFRMKKNFFCISAKFYFHQK